MACGGRFILGFALAVLSSPALAGDAPGEPLITGRDVAKALAEAAFAGLAEGTPAAVLPYGAYQAFDAGLTVTATRVDELNEDTRKDLLAITKETARLRVLVDQGRPPSRTREGCVRDPEPCMLADKLKERAKELPGGSWHFVGRALADRRTFYVALKNEVHRRFFKWMGGTYTKLLGIRKAVPVGNVSLKGVQGKFARAQWKSIRDIARRSDLVTEAVFKSLVKKIFKLLLEENVDEQVAIALEDFQSQGPPPQAPTENYLVDFRIRTVEAARIYAPVAAAAAPAPAAVVYRPAMPAARDPVITYAAQQNQMAQPYQVQVQPSAPTQQTTDWRDYEDRSSSSSIREISLPSSINWVGRRW